MARKHTKNIGVRFGAVQRFGVLTFGLTLGLTTMLHTWLVDGHVAWLIAVTVVTYSTFGYDKGIAGSKKMRVPEAVLLALTACGGTLGAIAGMRFFRHKTVKESFQFKFYLIVIAQVIAGLAYYTLFRQ